MNVGRSHRTGPRRPNGFSQSLTTNNGEGNTMHLNTNQLAAAAGVSRVSLWRWQRAGLIPAPERRGRQAIYAPAAVIAARSLSGAAQ
jgi:hypothetical protein